jgi:hypothetical protein
LNCSKPPKQTAKEGEKSEKNQKNQVKQRAKSKCLEKNLQTTRLSTKPGTLGHKKQ